MGKSSEVVAARIQQGIDLTARILTTVCAECEGECCSTEVFTEGIAGGEHYRTYLFVREHQSQGRAIQSLGRWMMGHGGIISAWEDRAWLLEHQPTLW